MCACGEKSTGCDPVLRNAEKLFFGQKGNKVATRTSNGPFPPPLPFPGHVGLLLGVSESFWEFLGVFTLKDDGFLKTGGCFE